MKGILTTLLFIIPIFSFGQHTTDTKLKIDKRLYEVYEADYLKRLRTTQPFVLKRLNFYLDNAFYLADYPTKKGDPDYPIIEISDTENLNILKLEQEQKLTRDFEKQVVYKIKGTNKILVYISGKAFNKKLNEHLRRKY
ncbi:MAG: hypothetical protein AAF573_22370 [Bacteroidota bacterium]